MSVACGPHREIVGGGIVGVTMVHGGMWWRGGVGNSDVVLVCGVCGMVW